MPYLLKSKGRRLVMRAGAMPKDPVYQVLPGGWTPFAELPTGVPGSGDGDVEVREISADEYKKTEKPKSVRELQSERIAQGKLTPSEKETKKELNKLKEKAAAKKGKPKGTMARLASTVRGKEA